VDRFVEQLRKNSQPEPGLSFTKRQIYTVRYGMNVGTEINGDRPSIIYKGSHSAYGEDIIVIPLTSAGENKSIDRYDMAIMANQDTHIAHTSYAKLRQMRCISAKRIGRYVGKIEDPVVRHIINLNIKKMLAVDT